MDWQKLGAGASFHELLALKSGVVRNRIYELVGRVASAGEQLGLAWTCEQEARRWISTRKLGDVQWQIASRALAEMTGYYALSAAHGLLNVTLRGLLLAPPAAAMINKKYDRAGGFEPFTSNRDAWLPISAGPVGMLREAAKAAGKPSAEQLVASVADLVKDARWTALTARRHVDFHRWRPQSISGGVPVTSPWQEQEGGWLLTINPTNSNLPPDAEGLVEEASAGLMALAEAMKDRLATWLTASRELTD